MDKQAIKLILRDLRYFTIFPRRYKQVPQDCPADAKERVEYFHKVSRAMSNQGKKIRCSCYHWYVITFKDGHKELAYLKWRTFPYEGLLVKGAFCRGLIYHHPIDALWYSHVQSIRISEIA